jgi:hypothetical protein
MAWSLPFTGKRSIITDSYQRIALTVSSDRLGDDATRTKLVELAEAYLLHVLVTIPEGHWRGTKATKVLNDLQSLSALAESIERVFTPSEVAADVPVISDATSAGSIEGRRKRLFLSIVVPHEAVEFAKVLATLSVTFDLWIIQVSGDKPAALNHVTAMSDILTTTMLSTSLGIGGCRDPIELDWYLTKIPHGAIKFVHLGDVALPDLKLHSIELAHTLGYNALLRIPAEALKATICADPQLCALAAKYDVPADTFLLKCLLQLGASVALPFETLSADYIRDHYSRLCHPFVHRKAFVSSNRVVTLQIQAEDMAVLTATSEEFEARSDAYWAPHAQGRSAERELTYTK